MKIGEIYKCKNGTLSTQTFIMIISGDLQNCVILFDNINFSIVGDTTVGYDINDFELSSIGELADFIVENRALYQ